MERYILPSVVNRGLHRLVTGSLGFGNLLPPQAICLGTVPQSEQIREVAELLSHELKIPLSDGLLKKIAGIPPCACYLLGESREASEDYLWGHKATNNVFIRGIFSALAFAELEFCERDLPQNSHEERLTGHLLSKMYSSVLFCSDSLTSFSKELYGEEVPVNVAYHDLSANNREKVTGSDFGIIVHTNLPGERERVQAVAFQAKKLYDKKAYLPIAQASAQTNYFADGAYTCLYDVSQKKDLLKLPPAILQTKHASRAPKTQHNYAINRKDLPPATTALSLFLIKIIQNENMNIGAKTFNSLAQAAAFMTGTPASRETNDISRVLTISIGRMTNQQELNSLTDLFPPTPSEEPRLNDL